MDKKLLEILGRLRRRYGFWKQLSGKYRQPVSLWHHSLLVADIAYRLAGLTGRRENHRYAVFIAGFLHDYVKSAEKTGPGRVLDELYRLLGDLVDKAALSLAYKLASHAESGPQPLPIDEMLRLRINPVDYDLLSRILAVADAIASMNSIYEYEKAFIYRDTEYWVHEHRWKRYLEYVGELEDQGIRFYSLRLTYYTHPFLRALVLDKLLARVLRGVDQYFKIYYPEGVAVIARGNIEPLEIDREEARRIAGEILDQIGGMELGYEKPRQGKPVTAELLMGEEDVEEIIDYYREYVELREGDPRIEAEIASKIARDVYGTARSFLPRDKLAKPDNIRTLDDLREYLLGVIRVKKAVDRELLADHLYGHVFRYYLGGSLVSINRSGEGGGDHGGAGHCYLCGEKLAGDKHYPFFTALAAKANLQVKYWSPNQKPLASLDNYSGLKYRLCPGCYAEVHIRARLQGRPPYIIIKHYPVMTDLVADETQLVIDQYVSGLGEAVREFLDGLRRRLKNLEERPLTRRLAALALIYRIGVLERVFNSLAGELRGNKSPDPLMVAKAISNSLNKVLDETLCVPEAGGRGGYEADTLVYGYLARYNLETVLPLSSYGGVDLLGIRKKSYEASKTVAVGVSPLMSLLAALTGGQVVFSDHVGVWMVGYAVEIPQNVFPNAVFYDVSGHRSGGPGIPLPVHLVYTTPLINAYGVVWGLERTDPTREFMRLYSLYTSQPIVFLRGSRVLNRILFHLDDPRRYLEELMFYLELVEVASLMGLDEASPKLVEVLRRLVDWMNKHHYVQSRTKHGYTAPLNRCFESFYSKLSLIDRIGRESLIELASAEFAERVRRDVEAKGYGIGASVLEEGMSIVKELLGILLDIYFEKHDTRLLRDLVNDIYNYVFIKRLIASSQPRKTPG